MGVSQSGLASIRLKTTKTVAGSARNVILRDAFRVRATGPTG
jgi:hypothetical protein